MKNDEIEKALRKGYKQSENIQRSPFVVMGVLLIMVLAAVLGAVI